MRVFLLVRNRHFLEQSREERSASRAANALPNPFRRPRRTGARIDRGAHRRVPLGVELVAVYFLRTLLGLSDCVGCNVARFVLRTSVQAPG